LYNSPANILSFSDSRRWTGEEEEEDDDAMYRLSFFFEQQSLEERMSGNEDK
jgi:hypothetical protein